MSTATPPASKVALPTDVAPLRKLTVPEGAPPLAGVTVAVRVSVWPTNKDVAEAVRVDVVAIGPATGRAPTIRILLLKPSAM
jgi:hypothetical protein